MDYVKPGPRLRQPMARQAANGHERNAVIAGNADSAKGQKQNSRNRRRQGYVGQERTQRYEAGLLLSWVVARRARANG
jgi:hypothetical protein